MLCNNWEKLPREIISWEPHSMRVWVTSFLGRWQYQSHSAAPRSHSHCTTTSSWMADPGSILAHSACNPLLANLEGPEWALFGWQAIGSPTSHLEIMAANWHSQKEWRHNVGQVRQGKITQSEAKTAMHSLFGFNPNIWNLHDVILQVPPIPPGPPWSVFSVHC